MFILVMFVEIAIVGGLLLIQPYVVRRGLLFGVYVGEAQWDGEDARAITRRWVAGMLAVMGLGVLLGSVLVALHAGPPPLGLLVSVIVLVAGSYAVYLRAYFEAKQLAAPGAPPAAATLVPNPPYSLVLPLLSLGVAIIGGSISVGYAWMHYAEMPASVPTHFGITGRPDAWSPRSFAAVMQLPLGALLVPTAIGIMACLVARAKRAIRAGDSGVSVWAQMRFRQATASFLSGAVILMSVMMGGMSIATVRNALGRGNGIPGWLMACTILLIVYGIGGSLYIAIRYGQGGARLEREASSAPLTNGVADNSYWYLGGFYVNRADPSFFVEKRFGIGYTINFGNPKAVLLLLAFLLIIAIIVVVGVNMPQTHTAPVR